MDIKKEIRDLQKKKNAVILAHNYQMEQVQEIADHIGDSFYLSKVAAECEHEMIVFCGVRFMAETASVLAPNKRVLLPEKGAGCPMADMICGEDVRLLKKRYPGVPVVSYVNSDVEVKSESDICCTSANAVKVVKALGVPKVIFVPDCHLGHHVAAQVPEVEVILWHGYCNTHAKVSSNDIIRARESHPRARVLVHPECREEVVRQADFVGSTSEIIHQAKLSAANEFIIGTESGVFYQLEKACPGKRFYLLHPGLVCPNMKKTTLESVWESLLYERHPIGVAESVAERARFALQRMLEV